MATTESNWSSARRTSCNVRMRASSSERLREDIGRLPGEVDDDCLHVRDESAELSGSGDFVPE
jgi:hypothetical protein